MSDSPQPEGWPDDLRPGKTALQNVCLAFTVVLPSAMIVANFHNNSRIRCIGSQVQRRQCRRFRTNVSARGPPFTRFPLAAHQLPDVPLATVLRITDNELLGSEVLQELKQLVGRPITKAFRWDSFDLRQGPLLHGQVSFHVQVCRFDTLVTEP